MRVLVWVLALLLSGCATAPLTAHIPVPVECPKINLPPKPELPIYQLNEDSAPDTVAKAYVASVYLQKKWIDEVSRD